MKIVIPQTRIKYVLGRDGMKVNRIVKFFKQISIRDIEQQPTFGSSSSSD